MLTQTSLASVYALANIINRRNKVLSTVPNSALADVCDNCSLEPCLDSDPLTQSVEERVVEAALAETIPGINDHDEEVEHIVDLASRAVSFSMDLTRNTVTPQIRQVVDHAVKYIDARRAKRATPLEIIPDYLADVYRSVELGDLTRDYAKAPVANVAPFRVTAKWPEGGMAQALATGIPSFDDQVQTHFAGKDDQVKELWEQFYAATPGKYRPSELQDAVPGMDESLVIFLGSHALLESDSVPDGMSGSLADYRSYLARLKEQTGSRLTHQYNTKKNAVAAKQLVVRAPKPANRGDQPAGHIVVNGELYNRWLTAGGSPETLYGAVTAGETLHYDALLARKDAHEATWARARTMIDTQLKFEQQSLVIAGLREGLGELARSLPADQLGIDMVTLYERIGERLSHFHVKDVNDVYMIARKAVCRIFYGHTDAEKILNAMDNVLEAHPGIDMREAALLVMIDYVTDWIGDGIMVLPIELGQAG